MTHEALRDAEVAMFLLAIPLLLPFLALLVGVGEEVGCTTGRRARGARFLGAALYSVAVGIGGVALVFAFGPWPGGGYGPPVEAPLDFFRYRLPGGPLWHGLVAPAVFLAAGSLRRAFLARVGVSAEGWQGILVPAATAAFFLGVLFT